MVRDAHTDAYQTKGAVMAKYQVRVWDVFYQNWVTIPKDYDTREQAIKAAIEMSPWHYCGFDGTEEVQVYVECLGGTAYQMVGYTELDEDKGEFVFEECFG